MPGRLGHGGAPVSVADGCGARVPGLVWVLKPVGFGDVMMDGVCPARGVPPLDLSRAAGPRVRGDMGLRELAARHQVNSGLGAERFS